MVCIARPNALLLQKLSPCAATQLLLRVRENVVAVCRTFADASGQKLISGGNDRQLLLWQLCSSGDSADNILRPTVAWQHTRKINGLALNAGQLYVADTSRSISIYSCDGGPIIA